MQIRVTFLSCQFYDENNDSHVILFQKGELFGQMNMGEDGHYAIGLFNRKLATTWA
jgi:hypothetical protein